MKYGNRLHCMQNRFQKPKGDSMTTPIHLHTCMLRVLVLWISLYCNRFHQKHRIAYAGNLPNNLPVSTVGALIKAPLQ